jgi:hypothetical protein
MIIVFKAQNIGFYAKFNDSLTAQEVTKNLPLEGTACKWGDEIYFNVHIKLAGQGSTLDVNVGDVAYWPEGKSICVFFGPTEASIDDKPVPASPVVIIGKTMASPEELKEVKAGEKIRVFIFSKKASFTSGINLYEDSRRLTQEEIDELVKKLLEEREQYSH